MSLADLANVVLSLQGPALTQVGFGTLALACYHTHNTDLSRTYSSVQALVADGFLTYEPAYRMLSRAFGQSPQPTTVKVIRLATPYTHVVKFTPTAAINNAIYAFTVNYKGVDYTVSFTADGTATLTEITAGLAAAFTALSATISAHATATGASTTFVSITALTPGDVFYYKNWTPNLKFEDITADPGIAADLAAIRNVDSDWYGLALDVNSKAIVVAADGFAETQTMLLGYNTSDSVCFDSAITTDVASVLQLASEARCIGYFDLDTTDGYAGCGGLAERFPFDPGSEGAGGTFHGKTIAGVTADALSDTQKANLRAKNLVVYETTAGINHTLDGKTPSGEFADQVRGLDWYRVRSQEAVASLILSTKTKIAFDDRGISMVGSELAAVQAQGEASELFVPGSSVLKLPKRTAVPLNDRKARKLTGIVGSVTLAGAIHLVDPINVSVGF